MLICFIQSNQGRRDSLMHEFSSNVNKVNRAVAGQNNRGQTAFKECSLKRIKRHESIDILFLVIDDFNTRVDIASVEER